MTPPQLSAGERKPGQRALTGDGAVQGDARPLGLFRSGLGAGEREGANGIRGSAGVTSMDTVACAAPGQYPSIDGT